MKTLEKPPNFKEIITQNNACRVIHVLLNNTN